MKTFKSLLAAMLGVWVFAGCGGGGGSSDGTASITARLLANGPFAAGATVPFEVTTDNFRLSRPAKARPAVPRHNGEDHGSGSGHGGGHDDAAMNPDATEGHYHVYLDGGEGTDRHLTGWSTEGEFPLPAETTPGTHTLRFELRDNNHVPVGAETVVFFEVR